MAEPAEAAVDTSTPLEQQHEVAEVAEPETGVLIAPIDSSPPVDEAGAASAPEDVPEVEKAPAAKARAPTPPSATGDLGFLCKGSAQADLLAAVAQMLPTLEQELGNARAVEATSEPLLAVLRRSQQQRGKRARR